MATAAATKMSGARAVSGQILRWSKNALARNKQEMIDPSNFSRVLAPPVIEVARDVTLRLQQQLSRVECMEDYVAKILDGGDEQQENKNPNVVTTGPDGTKLIKTSSISQPHWWKTEDLKLSPEEKVQRETTLKKAQKNLKSLKVLHENTEQIANTFWSHLETKTDPVMDKKEIKWLTAAFRQIRDRHAMTVENLAEFVITSRPYWDQESPCPLDDTIMDFLRGRLGVQLLCEHALAPDGIIQVDCPLQDVVEDAIGEAKLLCESHYSHLVTAAPDVVIVSGTIDRKDQFTCVRQWVHYVLVELLKNAMAISMERMTEEMENSSSCSNVLPPTIYVSIDDHHNDEEDKSYMTIDVFDQGGGFKNPELAKNSDILFDFVRTKDKVWDRLDDQQTYSEVRSPMNGLGVGLCLSRLMIQHFGGTVEIAQHPPLSFHHREALGHETADSLNSGCVSSVKLLKNLDHEHEP